MRNMLQSLYFEKFKALEILGLCRNNAKQRNDQEVIRNDQQICDTQKLIQILADLIDKCLNEVDQ